MATIRFPGGRGPAGAEGPEGPAGPAGSGALSSPQSAWVYEAGVEGVAVPFDAGDWQDAVTVAPVAGGVVAAISVVGDALTLTPAPNGGSAVNRPVELAIGDDLCARIVVCYDTPDFGSGVSFDAQLCTFNATGAATNWHGVGLESSNTAIIAGGTFGRFWNGTSASIVTQQSNTTQNTTGFFGLGALDLRISREAGGLKTYLLNGGAWWATGTALATGFTADAGNMAGIRMQLGASKSMRIKVIAWKHFVGGLPAGLQ